MSEETPMIPVEAVLDILRKYSQKFRYLYVFAEEVADLGEAPPFLPGEVLHAKFLEEGSLRFNLDVHPDQPASLQVKGSAQETPYKNLTGLGIVALVSDIDSGVRQVRLFQYQKGWSVYDGKKKDVFSRALLKDSFLVEELLARIASLEGEKRRLSLALKCERGNMKGAPKRWRWRGEAWVRLGGDNRIVARIVRCPLGWKELDTGPNSYATALDAMEAVEARLAKLS